MFFQLLIPLIGTRQAYRRGKVWSALAMETAINFEYCALCT